MLDTRAIPRLACVRGRRSGWRRVRKRPLPCEPAWIVCASHDASRSATLHDTIVGRAGCPRCDLRHALQRRTYAPHQAGVTLIETENTLIGPDTSSFVLRCALRARCWGTHSVG
jgi:hypothetical protein